MIFPALHLSNNLKEKKRKRNINNNLAILPSYDTVHDRHDREDVGPLGHKLILLSSHIESPRFMT